MRAIVGGRSFAESHFNRAVQAKRQPGSAFKPFVYAAALENGYTPASLIDRLDEPFATLQGDWSPEEGHASGSELTMRTALKTSSNRAAVRMLEMVGVSSAVDYAQKLGPGIGAGGAVAGARLRRGHAVRHDLGLQRVCQRRHVAPSAAGPAGRGRRRQRPVSAPRTSRSRRSRPATAFLMSSMLADVIDSGTAWKARQLGFRLPASGKTGTTNEYRDAWFVGYTQSLTAGVWVGYDTPRQILPGSAYAGDVAVPLWADFMKAATKGDKPEPLVRAARRSSPCRSAGCPASGRPAAATRVPVANDDGLVIDQSMIGTEYFVRGTEPERGLPPARRPVALRPDRRLVRRCAARGQVSEQRAAEAAPTEAPVAAPVSPAQQAPAVAEAPAPEPKKRGFWGRLFGRRDKPDEKDQKKDAPATRRPQ